MRLRRLCLAISCCLIAFSVFASGQNRKPGLYETTSEMNWQKSPFPPGMQMPPQAAAAFGGGKHTAQVCVTQDQIDRYGDAPPQIQRECKVTNISKTATGMKSEMVCTGQMQGKGTMEATWSPDGKSRGKVHFVGTMAAGRDSMPVEWTIEYVSSFKGPACGSVKPVPTS